MSTQKPKKALWAKCEACGHCWAAAYYPLEMTALARTIKNCSCPMGCKGAPVIAKQNNGKLQEEVRA